VIRARIKPLDERLPGMCLIDLRQRFTATRKAVDAFFAEHPDADTQTALKALQPVVDTDRSND
jgi:hypothetical protein